MRIKKTMVAIMVFILLATSLMGNVNLAQAAETQTIIISEDDVNLIVKPGETNRVKIPIKSVSLYISNPSIEVVTDADAPFTIATPSLSFENLPVSGISSNDTTYLEFDVKVRETASIGTYPITVNFEYDNIFDEGSTSTSIKTNINIIEERAPVQLTINNVECVKPMIGADTELSFTITNEGGITAHSIYISLNYGETGIVNNYTAENIKISDLKPGKEQTVTLPISILPTALPEGKIITVNFKYKNIDGVELSDTYNINFEVYKNEIAPDLYIESVSYQGELIPGNEFVLIANLKNMGGSTAKEIYVTVDDSNIGTEEFIRKYHTDIWVPNITVDNNRQVKIPLKVSKGATGGIKDLKININYKDNSGLVYSETESVYPEIIGVGSDKPSIIVSNVSQSPAQPVAGEKLVVSFDLENKSNVDISELKVSLDNLTGNSFIPIESEPYQYFEKIAGTEKIRVTIPLIVSDMIPEGLNNLGVNFEYNGGSDTVNIPILDVQNDLGSSSKPKLIVSQYTADVEELRAGSTFNFTFDIYNTHSSVAAKNITVTVTQAENVFSVTKGSNSFFIAKINAGETASNTLELKVKSDASTKAYPLKITIEYEYDGIEPNPETGEVGETKVEELNLQAVENSRPVVDYVNVYSWDGGVMLNSPATLAFEFYNMGKSPLNNVVATVEGDFTKSDGSMYFLGNVMEGGNAYAEFDVMPNVEGMAKGVLKITFEDSNGDEVSYSKEFETMVMGEQVFDPGMIDGGYDDVFNPIVPEAKKAIIPIWLFIIVQVVIFGLFIPITRKIIISVYKSKLRKKEEEQF